MLQGVDLMGTSEKLRPIWLYTLSHGKLDESLTRHPV